MRKAELRRHSLFQKFGNSILYCLAFIAKAPIRSFSEYLRLNPRTALQIRKELDEFNGDYEGTAAQKPHWSFWLEKNFRIYWCNPGHDWNDPRSIAKSIGRADFFKIWLVVHEDIQYFSYRWERANFYHRPRRKIGKTALQSLWTNWSISSIRT